MHNFVGLSTYSKCTKLGVTLPVLKNEIIDFFFARLGTGGNYDPTLLFGKRTERIKVYKLLEKKLFIYFMYTTLLVMFQI